MSGRQAFPTGNIDIAHQHVPWEAENTPQTWQGHKHNAATPTYAGQGMQVW
jgi:hypothetical protein